MGHVPTKVLLPVGLPVTLTLDDKDAYLLWAHDH
jgi:muramoyltetrapeptide carboxypeptidase